MPDRKPAATNGKKNVQASCADQSQRESPALTFVQSTHSTHMIAANGVAAVRAVKHELNVLTGRGLGMSL